MGQKLTRASALFLCIFTAGACVASTVAPTPPMGWNSWNWFGKPDITEQIVYEVIDAMATNGLRDAGYTYVVVDGGWRDTTLGPNKELRSHPGKFPGGMKPLADYAHSKGLKFGLHTVPGTHDCGGDPVGAFGHEEVHLKQFEAWGIDFIKLDKCKHSPGWNQDNLKATYARWSDWLASRKLPVVLSISAYRWHDWAPDVGNMARTTGDIRARIHKPGAVFDDHKRSVMVIADENNKWAAFARPGYWNDPDMLVTGEHGLNEEEQRTHFALWCMMSAPLMLGNDPRSMSDFEKSLVLNRQCIAINQDPAEQGRRIYAKEGIEVWVKKLSKGRLAVLQINRSPAQVTNTEVDFEKIGAPGVWDATDVFTQAKLKSAAAAPAVSISSHACRFLLLSPVK